MINKIASKATEMLNIFLCKSKQKATEEIKKLREERDEAKRDFEKLKLEIQKRDIYIQGEVLKEITSEKQWKIIKKETRKGKVAVVDCYSD